MTRSQGGGRLKQAARVAVVIAMLLALGIVLTVMPRRRSAPDPGEAPAESRHTSLPSATTLDSSLRAVAEGERTSARDRWDPEWLGERIGRDPEDARTWVRNQTAWIPYRGALRGPTGTLMDRQGNALDRSLLLAALLRQGGHSVRLAHAELSRARAMELLPELVARRRAAGLRWQGVPVEEAEWSSSMRVAALRYGLDADGIEKSLADGVNSMTRTLDELDVRVADQARRLDALLPARPRRDPAARTEAYVVALRDHWWVQRLDGDRWVDLDVLPTVRDSQRQVTPTEIVEVASIPDSLYHSVVVRLITERWSGGRLSEQVALESVLRPSEIAGQHVALEIWPSEWPSEVVPPGPDPRQAVRTAALEQQEWQATLVVGGSPVGDVIIDAAGAARPAQAGGPFGGLGRGIVGALGGAAQGDGTFTAAWLEYEVRVTGEPARRERRVLFDLPGPALRAAAPEELPALDEAQRLTRSLALMRVTEILPLGSVPDPEFVLHLVARATLTNGALVHHPRNADSSSDPGALAEIATSAAPVPTLYSLALSRFAWDTRGELFLSRPNILTRHDHLAPAPGGIRRIQANDIVANDVGVALDVADEFGTRLRQGIRDTNGEALLPLGARAVESVGEAFAAKGEWVAVVAPTDPALSDLRMSDDTRRRLTEELTAGHLLVVPRQQVSQRDDIVGWWRIDPATGQTLGVSRTGWGQSLAERAVLYAGIFSAAWAFEYLICRNGLYGLPGEPAVAHALPDPGSLLVTPAVAQTGYCSINALIAGILSLGMEVASATWPLVLRTIAGRGYSGWLSGRPMISTGGASSGKGPALPGRGGTPGPAAPPEKCPPGTTSSGEPAGAGEPLPEGQGASSAPVEPEPTPASAPYDGPEPYEPSYVEQQRVAARESAGEAEQDFEAALAAYRKAASEVRQPSSEAPTGEERALALAEQVAEKQLAQANAQRAAARDRQLTWERMGAVNDELIAARAEDAAAQEAMRRQLAAGGSFDGPAYDRWSSAIHRLTAAQRNFNAVRFGRAAPSGPGGRLPPRPQGETQPLPKAPAPAEPGRANQTDEALAATECAPGTGRSPGESPTDRLAEARRQLDEALKEYRMARDAFEGTNESFYAAEQRALEAGQPVPEHSSEYKALLRAKIDAMGRFDRMRAKYFEAGGKPGDIPPLSGLAGMDTMVGIAGAGSGGAP